MDGHLLLDDLAKSNKRWKAKITENNFRYLDSKENEGDRFTFHNGVWTFPTNKKDVVYYVTYLSNEKMRYCQISPISGSLTIKEITKINLPE